MRQKRHVSDFVDLISWQLNLHCKQRNGHESRMFAGKRLKIAIFGSRAIPEFVRGAKDTTISSAAFSQLEQKTACV